MELQPFSDGKLGDLHGLTAYAVPTGGRKPDPGTTPRPRWEPWLLALGMMQPHQLARPVGIPYAGSSRGAVNKLLPMPQC